MWPTPCCWYVAPAGPAARRRPSRYLGGLWHADYEPAVGEPAPASRADPGPARRAVAVLVRPIAADRQRAPLLGLPAAPKLRCGPGGNAGRVRSPGPRWILKNDLRKRRPPPEEMLFQPKQSHSP